MFCTSCGTENLYTSLHCIRCGHNLVRVNQSTLGTKQTVPAAHSDRWLRVSGWLAGGAIGFYTGPVWFYLFVPTVIIWIVGVKFLPKEKHLFLPVFAFQVGQMLWFVLGGVVSRLLTPTDLLEALILGATATWLLLRPSLTAVVIIVGLQAASIVVNLLVLKDAAVGSLAHRALALTIVWRGATLLLLLSAYLSLRKSKDAVPAP